MSPINIAVTTSCSQKWLQAQALAERLTLCMVDLPAAANIPFVLVYTPQHLALWAQEADVKAVVYVDFTTGKNAYRRIHGGGRAQPLARACGLRSGNNPHIIDATAGFGKDAFVLACLGARVTMLERNAVVAALLADGLHRACQDQEIGGLVGTELTLYNADAATWLNLSGAEQQADVIYLDPMYPVRQKSAKVKKDLQVLQQLVGQGDDNAALLEVALRHAKSRVVVKRPRLAPVLSQLKPDASVGAKNTRFDIYLV